MYTSILWRIFIMIKLMMIAIVFFLTAMLCLQQFLITVKTNFVIVVWIAWLLIVSTAAATGIFQEYPPSFVFILLGSLFCALITLRCSNFSVKFMNRFYTIHSLRIIVEVVLFKLYIQKKIPIEMTFEGWNIDLFFGLSALVILCYTRTKRLHIGNTALMAWNVCGLILVTWVLLIGILSSPLPLQQLAYSMPNMAVLEFPYVLLPSVIVPLVMLSHLAAIKRLR